MLLCLSVLQGCATLPLHVKRDRSQALADPAGTLLGRVVANSRGGHQELKLTLPPIGSGPTQSHLLPDENFLDN